MSTPNPSRTALITGASRGLGAAIALELGAMGANAAVNYLNSGNAAEQLCQRIRQAGGHAHAFKADVRSEIEVVRLVDEVCDAFGDIDVLVVNATGPQPFLSIEEQTWGAYRSRRSEPTFFFMSSRSSYRCWLSEMTTLAHDFRKKPTSWSSSGRYISRRCGDAPSSCV